VIPTGTEGFEGKDSSKKGTGHQMKIRPCVPLEKKKTLPPKKTETGSYINKK